MKKHTSTELQRSRNNLEVNHGQNEKLGTDKVWGVGWNPTGHRTKPFGEKKPLGSGVQRKRLSTMNKRRRLGGTRVGASCEKSQTCTRQSPAHCGKAKIKTAGRRKTL